MDDRGLRPATDLVAAIRNKEVSSVELLEHFVARIERLNPQVNAIVTMDIASARRDAQRLDELLLKDGPKGPLHGLPATVKDTLETAGMRTTAGARELADHVPGTDAEAVGRLRRAGAVIFGKTNTPAFADDHQTYNDVFGKTNNPWDISRTPGGSSGGSAVAVALGLTSFDLGSDIANSIRSPASHCGVFGHKPTHGLVSQRGHIPPGPGDAPEPDLAVVGPLTRSADDLDLLMDVLSGLMKHPSAQRTRAETLDGYRLAAWFEMEHFPVAPAVRTVLEQATDDLRRVGAKIDDSSRPDFSIIEAREVFNALLVAVTSSRMSDDQKAAWRARRDEDGPVGKFARNVTMTPGEWSEFDARRHEIGASWARFFEDFDAVLCPCNPLPPIHHDQPAEKSLDRTVAVDGVRYRYFDQSVWAGIGGVALLPGAVAPAGRTADGLPVGFQIVGPLHEDRTCIDVARHIERVLGGFQPPPMALL